VSSAASLRLSGDDLDKKLDALQRTLLVLLAKRRRETLQDDPELKKVLGLVHEYVEDVRRLRPTSPHGSDADVALARLIDVDERQLRERDAAWAIADGLKRALVRLGNDEYRRERLMAEDRRRTAGDRAIVDLPRQDAIEALLFQYQRRSDESRHREARRRIKARYLLHVGLLLTLLVPALFVAAVQSTDLEWWTIGEVALAGAVGATLSGLRRIRDELSAIEDLRTFRPAMLVQPLVGAAFALVIVMLLKAGLLGLTLPTGAAQPYALAVFAFVAGFSEPFVIGVVGRVAALADDTGSSPSKAPPDSEDRPRRTDTQ
jgi:hypothetical protein